ncbi:hypothetical protein D3C71_1969390 [compost metagenome]
MAADRTEQDLLAALAGLWRLRIVDHGQNAPLCMTRQVRAGVTGKAGAAGDQQDRQAQTQITDQLHRLMFL